MKHKILRLKYYNKLNEKINVWLKALKVYFNLILLLLVVWGYGVWVIIYIILHNIHFYYHTVPTI